MPCSAQLRSSATSISSASASRSGRRCDCVGMMWSTVAKVRPGKRTGRPHLAQHREGLRAGDLVDQVQADEELRIAARKLAHAVRVPDLVEQALAVAGTSFGGGMIAKIACSPPAAPGVSSGAWNCSTPRTSRPERGPSRRSSRSTAGARAHRICSAWLPICTAARRSSSVRRARSPSRSSRATSATAGSRSARAGRPSRRSSRRARRCCAAFSTTCCATIP